jgi:hypothetical protein
LRVVQYILATRQQHRKEAHAIGVIGDDEKVQWTRKLHALSARSGDFIPLSEYEVCKCVSPQ